MIPGFGLVRRTITIAMCGVSFWAGVKFAESGQAGACLDVGGRFDPRGFCSNEAPAP